MDENKPIFVVAFSDISDVVPKELIKAIIEEAEKRFKEEIERIILQGPCDIPCASNMVTALEKANFNLEEIPAISHKDFAEAKVQTMEFLATDSFCDNTKNKPNYMRNYDPNRNPRKKYYGR